MSKNKTGRYFKYAIGEILLVVIGILLALQINNWNQERVDNNYASLILKEIYYDLSNDYRIIYAGIEPRLNLKIKGVQKIKEFMIEGKVVEDSAFMSEYKNMNRFFALTQRTGAFESLKQSGLDKISNDFIRTQLLQFYESTIPRSVKFISHDDNAIRNRVKVLEDDIFKYQFSTQDDSTVNHIKVLRGNDYLNHQSLHKIYDILSDDTFQKQSRLKSLKRRYMFILKMVENELKNREVNFKYLDTTQIKRDFS